MFQSWRLKLREADEALRAGRLEEAGRLLRDPELQEFLPAKRLMARVGTQLAERAGARLAAGATIAGWRDLQDAEQFGAETAAVTRLKSRFLEIGLSEADAYLAAGDPAAAVARLEAIERQGVTGRELRLAHEAANKVVAAQQLCQRGMFGQAEEQLVGAQRLRPDWKVLETIRQACAERGKIVRRLVEHLHAALADQNWTLGLVHAEAILELCPDHGPALDARRRAWAAVGTELVEAGVGGEGAVVGGERVPAAVAASADAPRETPVVRHKRKQTPMIGYTPGPRFVLWVDGVGGFLVCRGDVVALGQPVSGSQVNVPILGDISRLHALVRRDGESYLIKPLRGTRVDGSEVDDMAALYDGCEIEMGGGVRLRFRLPNPLSRTARLDFLSRHRTQPTTDAVLLMAESCILSASTKAHIVCHDWQREVVLFPRGGALCCRVPGTFQVDGRSVENETEIKGRAQVVGEDFSFSVEPI